MNPHNFFAELKRRNVYKVAVAYAVVAWLLIQAASIFLPAFDAPPWVMKTFIMVIIFGFPVALVLSWAFEITPEGIKLESEIAPNESIKRQTGRKIVGITVVLSVIAAGLLAFNLFRTKPTAPPTTAAPITNNSVAVLAFANLSDDKGSEYFSDGISEELLTVLQKIPGLHVAARTSAFSFKGKDATAQEIGEKLGVAHLVEGSVRKAGDLVRIAARLTQANTGEERWSENLASARGEKTQSLEFNRQAVALDPVNAQARAFLASSLSVLGPQEEARAEYARVIELNPSAPNSHAGVGLTYLLEGKFEEAAVAAQKDAADWARLLIVSCARWAQKRVPESDAALAELIAIARETGAYQIAEIYGYRNDKDHAFEWLERARQQHDAGLPGLRADTLLPNLHDDPRWDAFMRKMGLADDQLK